MSVCCIISVTLPGFDHCLDSSLLGSEFYIDSSLIGSDPCLDSSPLCSDPRLSVSVRWCQGGGRSSITRCLFLKETTQGENGYVNRLIKGKTNGKSVIQSCFDLIDKFQTVCEKYLIVHFVSFVFTCILSSVINIFSLFPSSLHNFSFFSSIFFCDALKFSLFYLSCGSVEAAVAWMSTSDGCSFRFTVLVVLNSIVSPFVRDKYFLLPFFSLQKT